MKFKNAIQCVVIVSVFIGLRRLFHWIWPDHKTAVDVIYLSTLLFLWGLAWVIVQLMKRRLRAMGIDTSSVDD